MAISPISYQNYQSNNINFKADFDWLMSDRNMAKVLEGKYDNDRSFGKKQESKPKPINRFNDFVQNKLNQIELCAVKPFYIQTIMDKKKENLNNLALRLSSVSVESVLNRGFAWVKNDEGKTVYLAKEALKDSKMEIKFADGSIDVYTNENNVAKIQKTKTIKKEKSTDEKQISLFDI